MDPRRYLDHNRFCLFCLPSPPVGLLREADRVESDYPWYVFGDGDFGVDDNAVRTLHTDSRLDVGAGYVDYGLD